MIRAIIFDFDGVICESVEVKKNAFARLFANYPEHLEKIVDYHMANGGMSRYLKFEKIYRDFLKEKLTEEKSQELGRLFTEYSHEGVVNAPMVKGVQEFLDKYLGTIQFFVVSGTPEDEMLSVVKEMDLSKYFKGVYGSPRLKGELNKFILKEHEFASDEVIFVGDSVTDLQGAREANIVFIGRIDERQEDPFEDLESKDKIKDFTNFETYLKNSQLLPV